MLEVIVKGGRVDARARNLLRLSHRWRFCRNAKFMYETTIKYLVRHTYNFKRVNNAKHDPELLRGARCGVTVGVRMTRDAKRI